MTLQVLLHFKPCYYGAYEDQNTMFYNDIKFIIDFCIAMCDFKLGKIPKTDIVLKTSLFD